MFLMVLNAHTLSMSRVSYLLLLVGPPRLRTRTLLHLQCRERSAHALSSTLNAENATLAQQRDPLPLRTALLSSQPRALLSLAVTAVAEDGGTRV